MMWSATAEIVLGISCFENMCDTKSMSPFKVQHKYFPACPGEWIFEKMAFGQVHLSFHLPK